MAQTVCLLIAAILFFMAGCGKASWTFGSVSLSTVAFGLFFFVLAGLLGAAWPWRAAK